MDDQQKIRQGLGAATPDTSASLLQMAAGVCIIAFVLGYAGNLAILALNARMAAAGAPAAVIGFSTSIQAAGIVIGALAALRLRERWGTARSISFGLCLAAVSLASLSRCDTVFSISMFRFCLAAGVGIALSQSEYVLVMRTLRRRCAVLIAAYATFFAFGTLLASVVTADIDTLGALPFAAGAAGLVLAACIPRFAAVRARADARVPDKSVLRFSDLSAATLIPALAYGVFEGGLISLFNVYALDLGYGLGAAALLVSVAIAGSLMLRIPLGLLAAFVNPRLTLRLCWCALCLLLAAMHFCASSISALLVLAWLLGGVCDLFYIVGLAALAGTLRGHQLGQGSSLFVATAGVGEILGPALGGIGLGLGGASGFLFAFLAFACAGLIASLGLSMRRESFPAAALESV